MIDGIGGLVKLNHDATQVHAEVKFSARQCQLPVPQMRLCTRGCCGPEHAEVSRISNESMGEKRHWFA